MNIKLIDKFVLSVLSIVLSLQVNAQGLGQLASKVGLNYGTMVHKAQFKSADPTIYRQTLVDEFNMAFPENEIKWSEIEPTQNYFNFTYPDEVIAFAQANGMKSRGHFMIWHTNLPTWLTSRGSGANQWTRQELLDILKNHINKVIGHYKGKIHEYDVVNEPFALGNGNRYGLRSSMWYNIIGPDYIDSAFVFAHRADPQAYLYLNEYGAENSMSTEYAKSDSLYKFVSEALARGVPIHGIGFESHFGNYINAGTISLNMKRLGDLGLRVSVTELDMMNTTNLPNNWVNLMNACLSNYNCTSFVTWGIDDKNSWKGSDCGCLVWDTLFQKKPAIYNGLFNALKYANVTIGEKRKAFAAQLPYPQTALPEVTPYTFCKGEVVSTPLTAKGSQLSWYKDATVVNKIFPPIPSTKDTGTVSYFVTQTVNFIESRRVEVKVTVKAPTVWYKDVDGDGVGNKNDSLISCIQPQGYVKSAAPTGVNEVYNDLSLSVYPQPFQGTFIVKTTNSELIKAITICDLSGVKHEEHKNLNDSYVELGGNLRSGGYLMTIQISNQTIVRKIIKIY